MSKDNKKLTDDSKGSLAGNSVGESGVLVITKGVKFLKVWGFTVLFFAMAFIGLVNSGVWLWALMDGMNVMGDLFGVSLLSDESLPVNK